MSQASFRHVDLALLNPSFDSPLVDVLTELEHLRRLQLVSDAPANVFLQLKQVFHMLESLGSARIEGNHTTLADYVDTAVGGQTSATDQLREISNIEKAMTYVEEVVEPGTPLTEHFIRELHAMAVNDLTREGDRTPGIYRTRPVTIAKSAHRPPDAVLVAAYMQELTGFVNQDHPRKYDLIKVALAHHRFGWVHPFSNGNGRVVRLLTYAMLIKYGFAVRESGRVLNPTAVFCNDRERYYEMLGAADKGDHEGLDTWCTYVLEGILEELRKVDRLTSYAYVKENILDPALAISRERQLISIDEFNILSEVVRLKSAKSADLAKILPKLTTAQRTYQIRKLVESRMLQPTHEGARQYSVGFANNFLLRGVVHALSQQGFVPETLE